MRANHPRAYTDEWRIITERPGIRGFELRREAGWCTRAVEQVLANMEQRGYLLAEYERGGLYTYQIVEEE